MKIIYVLYAASSIFWPVNIVLGDTSTNVSQKPNVVFIYADDLGFGDLPCHGHPHIKTPNLDRIAREGTDFWSFTVVNPVCSPSRTGIVTGQFPSRWGVHQHFATHDSNLARNMPDWLDPKAPLLPRVFHQAGYRTGHFGKWHLSGGGIDDAPLPAEYGYDEAAVWTGPGRHVFEGAEYSFAGGEVSAHDKEASSWISVAATDHVVRFIRESKEKPFYINLWLHETHHLVAATEKDKELYPDTPEPHRTYYAAVSRADRQVGRVLAVLDELGLAKNTLVIFSSDNGPENSQPHPTDKLYHSVGSTSGLRGRKRSLLMGGVNVPFLVRWPGVVPSGRVDKETPLAGVDVFPTLLAAANLPVPDGYVADGENMIKALQGQSQARSKPVFWWWQGKHTGDDWPTFAMRDGPWTLILDETKQRTELYNVIADRLQAKNIAAEQPERVKNMKEEIDRWFATIPSQIDASLQSKIDGNTAKRTNALSNAKKPQSIAMQRAQAMVRWDKNNDRLLTLEEYKEGLKGKDNLEARFQSFDKNKDGKLTRDEFVGTGNP